MANRSYLYSVNKIPTGGILPDIINGMSEFEEDIPLVFKIMLGNDPLICQSIIFDNEKTGIIADFQQGLKDLLMFLELLNKEKVKNSFLFEEFYKETLKFLNKPKNAGKFVLLEPGEIIEMEDDDANTAIKNLITDIKEVSTELKSLFILFEDPKNKDIFKKSNLEVFQNIQKEWEYTLGIDCWSSSLYYHFPKNKQK